MYASVAPSLVSTEPGTLNCNEAESFLEAASMEGYAISHAEASLVKSVLSLTIFSPTGLYLSSGSFKKTPSQSSTCFAKNAMEAPTL